MIRTQIQLTEEQMRLLKELSRGNNQSIAALIRSAIDQFLVSRKPDRLSLYRQAMGVVGKYESGVGDISLKHDLYLEDAFEK